MTFYVEKKLALGPISFGVSPNRRAIAPDDDASLSTGASGEFIRRRSEGFFFGGQDRFTGPAAPTLPTIASKPFWESFKSGEPARRYGFFALLIVGALFILLGFAVVARKGSQGWVEVILGAAMVATPILMTAQQRRKIREEEERARAEREATDKRNREMLAAYTAALERARNERSTDAFAQLAKERAALTLPEDIWTPAAHRTVLQIAFDEFAKGTRDLSDIIDRASNAAGLSSAEATSIRYDLYATLAWHLLADDRLGPVQARHLASIREGLGIADDDARSIEQFQRLRSLTAQTLPHQRCTTQLGFGEYCVHEAATDQGTLHVTNKRVIVDAKKRVEIPIARAFDVVANVDDGTITVKTENPKKPLRLRVEQPIYTAAMLDLAAAIDERPKGFA